MIVGKVYWIWIITFGQMLDRSFYLKNLEKADGLAFYLSIHNVSDNIAIRAKATIKQLASYLNINKIN